MEYSEEIIKSLNKSLIESMIIPRFHKIFIKYSSHAYFNYAFELLDTLSKKSSFNNKNHLLYTCINYLIKILYNCGNIPFLSNYDLMILCCFSIGIKTTEIQKNMISLTKLKNIYSEKYSNYDNDDIKKGEMTCIYLLNYNINFLTAYDCICYLLNNDDKFIEASIQELKIEMCKNVLDYVKKKPLEIAKESIKRAKIRMGSVCPCFIVKRIKPKTIYFNHVNKNRNEESFNLSTSTSFASNNSPKNRYIYNSLRRLKKMERKKSPLSISVSIPFTQDQVSSYESPQKPRLNITQRFGKICSPDLANLNYSFDISNMDKVCNNNIYEKKVYGGNRINNINIQAGTYIFKKPFIQRKDVKTSFNTSTKIFSKSKVPTCENIKYKINEHYKKNTYDLY